MFGRKRPKPDPIQSSHDKLMDELLRANSVSAFGPPPPTPGPWQTSSAAFLNSIRQTGLAPGAPPPKRDVSPEPTTTPETQFGIVGYRLYTLDDELYLVGVRGERQKGNASEQAKHTADQQEQILARMVGVPPPPSGHPAPAWDCLCGFAAFFSPTSLDKPEWGSVLAEVQAEGRTVVSGNKG